MGWMEDVFVERLAVNRGVGALWNEMRDSVGQALMEYGQRTLNLAVVPAFRSTDCQARGRFCIRVVKHPDAAWLEIFLDQANRVLKTAQEGGVEKDVCQYRLGDQGLQFYTESEEAGVTPISIESACRKALEKFMLDPFPAQFRDGQNIAVV